ncbi:MAG: Acetoin:2,6-dichlorophenolindophenol oxidoreductase subunit alpha [Myxococcota bacterium]|nr:Acetoin:2,6-dichlorophenolindophenol oxidoreductase subunit alpha [Myxococcota bacterium]
MAISKQEKKELYRLMALNRAIEERLTILYRQGKVVGGLYRSLGQEATSVGAAYALRDGDYIGAMIRNLGSLIVRGVKPREVMLQYMARKEGPTGGRDCNLHMGDMSRGIVACISMLGDLIPVMAGVGLALKKRNQRNVAMTFIGDGGASTGAFHEGLIMAAAMEVPLVLIVENNGYAYSTPTSKQFKTKDLLVRAQAYGIEAAQVDGNDIEAVVETARAGCEYARKTWKPYYIEAMTFRMKGHAEHDDASYVPKSLMDKWRVKDPIINYEKKLLKAKVLTQAEVDAIHKEIQSALDLEVDAALNSSFPDPAAVGDRVYA